ncbi:lipid-transfer protein [Tistrella mobilis]|jgi:acetyl-CoA acetyltransferase|uniref:propanoyl-CoA C-acyltransferase n=2 Tax=Tistrella mobilis TaxID=171437 RepID=I3TJ76_TISMK|nr:MULTISPECIES: lipid-transfer protein [Tistrella]AFK52814.1 lipid-transfer protein [Tistrella mobilis KA081020-065]KYO51348.1 lipid-transfer protein [Tistrella mobilis]MAD38264.1 lipid-transfer protein [Tistrella sp.]HAE50151.1 lipid-transfer protein [Tistrella mobilis]
MVESVRIAGVGMIPFVKPGTSAPYSDMGAEAARQALADAGIGYDQIQQAYVGYVYGDSTCGQAALYEVGMSGIPVVNVNNNCSTGSSALFLARQAVASGAADCVLALGFEQMVPGALADVYQDRPSPMAKFIEVAKEFDPAAEAPMAIRLFGGAGKEYQQKYGASDAAFAMISVKARRHAEHNERAIFRTPTSVEEVLASKHMYGPLTRLQCCPPTCGAAAAVVVSEAFARKHGLTDAIRLRAQVMTTDFPSSFGEKSMMKAVGYDMARAAADAVYEQTGVDPMDVSVVEMHDCFTANELISYEALRLTPEGTAEKFIMDGDNTYGGRVVTNPSGGLISKGHPLGATGLAQCAELVWQLRGQAGPRQVEGAKIALQHNLGLGGACVISLYDRA